MIMNEINKGNIGSDLIAEFHQKSPDPDCYRDRGLS